MSHSSRRFGRAALLLMLLSVARPSSAEGLMRLEVGKPIERPTQGGTSDFTEFVLPAGGFARIQVDQRNAGVRVSVLGPDGLEIDWTDETGSYGSEFIAVLGGPAGIYKLEIRNMGPPDYQGPVLVTLVTAREGQPGDRGHIDADLKFREANNFRRKQDSASLRKAMAIFTEAIPLYEAAGDWPRKGETINRRGQLHLSLNEYDQALADFETSQNIFESHGDRKWKATTLHNTARVYLARAELLTAKDLFERALVIRREVADVDGETYTKYYLGVTWGLLGETSKAIELIEETLPVFTSEYDQLGRIMSWNSLAGLQAQVGDFQKAIENYDLVLEKSATQVRNPQTLAASRALQGKARVYLTLGDLENAQAWNDKALTISRELQNKAALASNLELAGELRLKSGDARSAITTLEESLAIRKETSDRPGQVKTLGQISGAFAQEGDHAAALARLEQAMQIATEVGIPQGVAAILVLQSAELESLGKFAEAKAAAEAALPLYQSADDRLGEANSLHRLARAQRGLGMIPEALVSVTGSIERFESLRGLIDSPELRTLWRATTQGAYELLIDLRLELNEREPGAGHDVEAFVANEQALARGLLESLGSSRAGLRQDAAPELLARRAELSRKANALEFRRMQAVTNRAVTPPDPDELRGVLAEARELEGRILAASPRYAAVTLPKALSLAAVQRELGADTLVLELSLGERRSVLWVVSADGLQTIPLPPRAEIEEKARALHASLAARNAVVSDPTVAARRARLAREDASASKQAAALTQLLLGPAAAQLGHKRLVVVADGAMRLIPFAALREPSAPGRLLVAQHEIVNLPSAAVLSELRRDAPLRTAPSSQVAMIADPVYEATDPRVHRAKAAPVLLAAAADSPSTNDISRAARDAGLLGFPRLRFSRKEVDAVAALVPADALTAVDFAASRENATSPAVSQARIVHFATHSLMNTVHPSLSGLVLSLVDEEGKPQDGFLRLHEIYNLELRADLVVLSACQTAVGKEFQGEGLVALTRGFLAAGAPRVVASLWSVDDRATAELMQRFYTGLLTRKLTAAAALRSAQLALARDPRWAAPYYWAGFGLQGEWR